MIRFLNMMSLLFLTGTMTMAEPPADRTAEIDPELRSYLQNRIAEFDEIPDERKRELRTLSRYVKDRIAAGEPARLNFICTHNSRRSQMAQIWASAAACYYGVCGVETFSGGTESTAFNPRAVAAIARTGVRIEKLAETPNPRYAVRLSDAGEPLICFSKVHNEPPNPEAGFCAVMTCSDADENCPVVHGSSLRVAIPYGDPKAADGTPQETDAYDERCRRICREMMFVFSEL